MKGNMTSPAENLPLEPTVKAPPIFLMHSTIEKSPAIEEEPSITLTSIKTPLLSTVTNIITMIIYYPGKLTNALDVAKVDNNMTRASWVNPSEHITQADLDFMNHKNASMPRTEANLNSRDFRHLPCTFQFLDPTFKANSHDAPIIIPDSTERTDWGVDNVCSVPILLKSKPRDMVGGEEGINVFKMKV